MIAVSLPINLSINSLNNLNYKGNIVVSQDNSLDTSFKIGEMIISEKNNNRINQDIEIMNQNANRGKNPFKEKNEPTNNKTDKSII